MPMKLELEMKIDRNECVLVGVDIQSCVGGRATEGEKERGSVLSSILTN